MIAVTRAVKYGAKRSPSPLGVTMHSVPDSSSSVSTSKLAAVDGGQHPGSGVGVGQAQGGEEDGSLALVVDLQGGGVLLRRGVVAVGAEDVLDLVAGPLAGVDPVAPLAQRRAGGGVAASRRPLRYLRAWAFQGRDLGSLVMPEESTSHSAIRSAALGVVRRRDGRPADALVARRSAGRDDPDRATARAGGADRLEVLRLGGRHHDRAVPVEDVGHDEARGLAGAVGAEHDGGHAVVPGEQAPGGSAAAGDQAPTPLCGIGVTAMRSLLPSDGPAGGCSAGPTLSSPPPGQGTPDGQRGERRVSQR